MSELKLGAASVDLGKLANKFKQEGNGRTAEQFVREELADVVGSRTLRPAKAPTLCCTASVVSAACWRAS
jgi:glyceraldehyde 3-phosphate dehydrogenase